MCALACPFGAIIPGGTPVPGQELNVGQYSYVNTPFEPDPMFLRELSYQEQLSLLKWNVGQKTVAVKCDLCYFRPRRTCLHNRLSAQSAFTCCGSDRMQMRPQFSRK